MQKSSTDITSTGSNTKLGQEEVWWQKNRLGSQRSNIVGQHPGTYEIKEEWRSKTHERVHLYLISLSYIQHLECWFSSNSDILVHQDNWGLRLQKATEFIGLSSTPDRGGGLLLLLLQVSIINFSSFNQTVEKLTCRECKIILTLLKKNKTINKIRYNLFTANVGKFLCLPN